MPDRITHGNMPDFPGPDYSPSLYVVHGAVAASAATASMAQTTTVMIGPRTPDSGYHAHGELPAGLTVVGPGANTPNVVTVKSVESTPWFETGEIYKLPAELGTTGVEIGAAFLLAVAWRGLRRTFSGRVRRPCGRPPLARAPP
jgi:hypothetical protein